MISLFTAVLLCLLPRPRRGLRGIVFTRSVCLCVCVCVCLCVCPANILVFYFSAIRRDIDLKFIQDTDRVVLNSLKKTFIGQMSRSQGRYITFKGTVISQKLSHRKISVFFHRHLLGYSIR